MVGAVGGGGEKRTRLQDRVGEGLADIGEQYQQSVRGKN